MLNKYPKLIEYIEEYREIILKEQNNPRFRKGSLDFIRQDSGLMKINRKLDLYTKDDFLIMHKINDKDYSSDLLIRFPVYQKAYCIKVSFRFNEGSLKFNSVGAYHHPRYEDYLSGITEVACNGNKSLSFFSIRDKEYISISEVINEGIKLAKVHFKKTLESPLIVKVNPNTKDVINRLEITMDNYKDICIELDLGNIKANEFLQEIKPKNNSLFSRLDQSRKILEENIQYAQKIMLKKNLEKDMVNPNVQKSKIKTGFKL